MTFWPPRSSRPLHFYNGFKLQLSSIKAQVLGHSKLQQLALKHKLRQAVRDCSRNWSPQLQLNLRLESPIFEMEIALIQIEGLAFSFARHPKAHPRRASRCCHRVTKGSYSYAGVNGDESQSVSLYIFDCIPCLIGNFITGRCPLKPRTPHERVLSEKLLF
jgi:hypothetical protein